MTIQITLPPATEERLRAAAEATGKNISTFVAEAIEVKLSLAQLQLREVLAPVHGDLKRSGMTDEELENLLKSSLAVVRSERKTAPGAPTKGDGVFYARG